MTDETVKTFPRFRDEDTIIEPKDRPESKVLLEKTCDTSGVALCNVSIGYTSASRVWVSESLGKNADPERGALDKIRASSSKSGETAVRYASLT